MTKDILIGPASQIGPLHITPLMWQGMSSKTYEAPPMNDFIKVSELDDDEGPRVEHIYIENLSSKDLFLPSGWVLGGSLLQTRILDFDEFIAAGSAKVTSVSCVEKGRWSGGFNPLDGGRAPISVALAGWTYEHQSRKWQMSTSKRQSSVWHQVSRQESRNGERSTNSLMQVMREDSSHEGNIRKLHEELDSNYSPMYGQNGILVSIAGAPLIMEFYSNEAVAQRITRETLKSLTFDVEGEKFSQQPESRVSDFIASAGIDKLHFLREEDWAVLFAGGNEEIDVRASLDSANKFVHLSAINRNHPVLLGA
jgi:hypothetical protein